LKIASDNWHYACEVISTEGLSLLGRGAEKVKDFGYAYEAVLAEEGLILGYQEHGTPSSLDLLGRIITVGVSIVDVIHEVHAISFLEGLALVGTALIGLERQDI